MFAISGMATDSCHVYDCVVLKFFLLLDAVWLFISYMVTATTFVQNKRIVTTMPDIIFKPYIAVPIYIGILFLAMALEGKL